MVDLKDAINIELDQDGRLKLKVRKDFYSFLVAARTTEVDDEYLELDTAGAEFVERPSRDVPGTVRAEGIGDDPPCRRRWQ